jgi:hypothetical protein
MRLVVELVDSSAYNGARERNPFNSQHFSLMEIGIYLTGQLHGLKLLKSDVAANRYVVAYAGLFGGTNKINRENDTTSTGPIMLADMRCMPTTRLRILR